jgi:hypothetical protein
VGQRKVTDNDRDKNMRSTRTLRQGSLGVQSPVQNRSPNQACRRPPACCENTTARRATKRELLPNRQNHPHLLRDSITYDEKIHTNRRRTPLQRSRLLLVRISRLPVSSEQLPPRRSIHTVHPHPESSSSLIMSTSFTPPPAAPMRALLLLLLILTSSFLLLPVAAYPTGAGGCVSGAPSVGSPHLPSSTGDLTLTGNGIEVSVDGTVLDPSTPFAITAGSEHVITVSATGATPFRGFLVALSTSTGLDLSTALLPQDTTLAQVAGACTAPLFGVTHTSNADKTTASALLNLADDADLTLDVTVVIQNVFNGVSQYGYAGYQLTNSAAAAVTYVWRMEMEMACVAARYVQGC